MYFHKNLKIYLENDSLLGDCLYNVASEGDLGKKWIDFGSRLGLTYGQLQDIELTSIGFTQCTRKVIIQWRDQMVIKFFTH